MWTRDPIPTFVEDLSEFCGKPDGKICFVTAVVEDRSELRRVGDKAADSLKITLRDQLNQCRSSLQSQELGAFGKTITSW